MLIHDFHSKMVSGKDEGKLIEALRKVRKVEGLKTSMASMEDEAAWNVWAEDEIGGGTLSATKA